MKILLIPAILLCLGACSTSKTPVKSFEEQDSQQALDNETKRLAIETDQQKFDHEIERKLIDACIAKGGVPVKAGNQVGCAPPFKQTEKARDEAAACFAKGGNWITVGDSARCTK